MDCLVAEQIPRRATGAPPWIACGLPLDCLVAPPWIACGLPNGVDCLDCLEKVDRPEKTILGLSFSPDEARARNTPRVSNLAFYPDRSGYFGGSAGSMYTCYR